MTREQLRAYLHKQPLVDIIKTKMQFDSDRKQILEALERLREYGLDETAETAVFAKAQELSQISKNYGNCIEDTWGVTWQNAAIIKRHIDYSDADIDKLPETLKF